CAFDLNAQIADDLIDEFGRDRQIDESFAVFLEKLLGPAKRVCEGGSAHTLDQPVQGGIRLPQKAMDFLEGVAQGFEQFLCRRQRRGAVERIAELARVLE